MFLIEILDKNYLRLKILGGKTHNEKAKLKRQFENQITKFQNCILCGACASICEYSAINLNGKYIIDETRCKHCLKCVYISNPGCIVADSLLTRGEKTI